MLARFLLQQRLQCRIRACVVKWSLVQPRCFSVAQGEKQAEALQRRPPIVSVMGHVNHGKTSLLDYLRSTQVVEKEAGGITQHIGAFSVLLNKEPVTFLDTPGHEAFSVLRSRGAQLTDLIVLVIAIDDGVQPQTVEVIKLSHKMKVPLIVAVNKVDKRIGSVDKIFNQLLQHNVQVEQLGGDIQATSISATTGKNIDSLLEAILVEAELLNLRANYSASVEAVVVESKMTKGFGATASLIVQEGTLDVGDKLYSKSSWARIRAMRNEAGAVLTKATPAMPVFTMGWKELPEPGEIVVQEKREGSIHSLEEQSRVYSAALNDPGIMKVPLLIKGDTSGSVETLISVLKSLDTSKAAVNVIDTSLGNIAEGDLKTAQTIKGIVLGFGVNCSRDLTAVADKWSVPVLLDNVIYRLLGQLKDHVEKMLPAIEEDEILGEAKVLEMFKLTGSRKAYVAGCKVTTGYLLKDKKFIIFRNGKPVYQGKLLTMKHHQNDVFRLAHGTECGLGFEKNTDIQPGDVIKCVANKQVVQTIDWKF